MTLPIIQVDPRKLKRLPTTNPNVMEPQVFEALCKAIEKYGMLQPVLVVEEDDEHLLIDGVHRSEACIEIGLFDIPAVLAEDREHAELLRIGMNKMRGELDLTTTTEQLQLLLTDGFDMQDLELTGFPEWEITALLQAAQDDGDVLTGADVTMPAPEKEKTFPLVFKFESESERAKVKETLEALGSGNAHEGLTRALDKASRDWRKD